MATSGSFTGARPVTHGPYLYLSWSQVEQDLANNKTKLKLTLYLKSDYYINFGASKTGSIQGASYTYSSGARGTGTWQLASREIWVAHNADGTKSVNLSGYLNIKITWSGTWVDTISVSGTATLNTIPRTSTITSLSGTTIGNTSTVSLKVGSSSFKHTATIWFGGERKKSVDIAAGKNSFTFSLTLSETGHRIPNSTSGELLIYLSTYSGSTLIGTTSKSFTYYLPDGVKPTAGSITLSEGNGTIKALSLGYYVQGQSKINFTHSGFAGAYGSTIKKIDIYIAITDKVLSSRNAATTSQIGSGTWSGSFSNPTMTDSQGSLFVEAVVADSRGRLSYTNKSISIVKYNPPSLSNIVVKRININGADNAYGIYGSYVFTGSGTSLKVGTTEKNPLSYTITAKDAYSGGTYTLSGTVVAGNKVTRTDTSNSYYLDKAYTVTIKITDKLGNSYAIVSMIPLGAVTMHLGKDSVAIGTQLTDENYNLVVGTKGIHNQGDLKTDGDLDIGGNISANLITPRFSKLRIGKNENLNDYTTPGLYYCDYDVDAKTISNNPIWRSFSLIVTQHAGVSQILVDYLRGEQGIYHRNFYGGTWGSWEKLAVYTQGWIEGKGSYRKYTDGTLECWIDGILCGAPTTAHGSIWCSTDTIWTFPAAYKYAPVVTSNIRAGRTMGWTGLGSQATTGTQTSLKVYYPSNNTTTSTLTAYAIGTWK